MNSVTDIDIQIKSIRFVVDRPQNPTWSFSVDERREHFVLAYAQSGAAFYTIGGEKIHVKKGNVVFMKPHQAYCAQSDAENPWSFFSVAFVAEFGDEESKKFFLSLKRLCPIFRKQKWPESDVICRKEYKIEAKKLGHLCLVMATLTRDGINSMRLFGYRE